MRTALHSVLLLLAIVPAAPPARAQGPPPEPPAKPRIHHGPMDTRPAPRPSEAPPELLPRPFTAEQICAELTPGLVVTWRITTPDGVDRQRWTVVDGDGERVTIEHSALDEAGAPTGQALRKSTSCADLRDHASYPAERAVRDRLQGVETPLGALDGWLYRVREEDGTVTGSFFADAYPGAPIFARAFVGEDMVREMVQVARERALPDASGQPPPAAGR